MTDLTSIIKFLSDTLANGIIPLLIGLAVVGFIYGIIQYFLNSENEEKRKKGKEFMLWGIIALFVIISFWGIVNILQNTFTKDVKTEVHIPKIPQQ